MEERKQNLDSSFGIFVNRKRDTNITKLKSEDNEERNDDRLKDLYCFRNNINFSRNLRYCLPLDSNEGTFFPYYLSDINMENKLCRYLWNLKQLSNYTDQVLFKQMINEMNNTLKKTKSKGFLEGEVLIFNNSLCCLNTMDQIQKNNFIRILAQLLSYPNSVKWISVENKFLLEQDGLRLLLCLSLGARNTLEHLHVWNIMRNTRALRRPSKKLDDFSYILFTEGIKIAVKKKIISQLYMHDIPKELYYFAYHTLYYSLENLNTLSIKYNMLVKFKGEGLCHLGCVRSGKLRTLNLLYTLEDVPKKLVSIEMSNTAWAKALAFCPLLKVRLVSMQVIHFNDFKCLLLSKLPLEWIHISSCNQHLRSRDWLLGRTMLLLLDYYKETLKRLSFNLSYNVNSSDLPLTNLIFGCSQLEEFEYRGKFEKIITIKNICEFFVIHKTRLKKLQIMIREDPQNPELNRKPLEEIQNEYKEKFTSQGINFQIGSCKI